MSKVALFKVNAYVVKGSFFPFGKIKKDKIPALVPDSRYYIDPIKELYFNTGKDSKQQQLAFFQHCDVLLLYISLISALLVLIIACFNYTNLTLSRTLQQLKMIHIEKLMGAKSKEIRSQLFLDAALTVLFAFLLSLLLINDMLPWFNNLLSTRLSFSFFFIRSAGQPYSSSSSFSSRLFAREF